MWEGFIPIGSWETRFSQCHICSQLNEFLYFPVILHCLFSCASFVMLWSTLVSYLGICPESSACLPVQKQTGEVAESPTPLGIHWSLWQGSLQSAAAVV